MLDADDIRARVKRFRTDLGSEHMTQIRWTVSNPQLSALPVGRFYLFIDIAAGRQDVFSTTGTSEEATPGSSSSEDRER